MYNRRPTEIDAKIGAKLREVRISKGLTLEAFGRIIGVSFQQVQKFEKGENRLRASQLYTLAKVLDINVDSFLDDIKRPRMEKSTIEMKQERKLLEAFSSIESQKNRRLILGVVHSIKSQISSLKQNPLEQ